MEKITRHNSTWCALVVLTLIFCSPLFVQAAESGKAQVGSAKANVLDKNMVVSKVDEAGKLIQEKTPASVKIFFTTLFAKVEQKREAWIDTFELKKNEAQAKLDALKDKEENALQKSDEPNSDGTDTQNYIEGGKENSLKKPLYLALVIFFTILVFIVSHVVVFYGLELVLIYLILREIWARIGK